ncbi:MAG: hypothetical protein B7X55_00435 [Rhodobacterales bacterium 34-62-10]|nr:MAG: hypothetical protein B7X55_00435 [Rhodobacterales bacterium 34-62-10]
MKFATIALIGSTSLTLSMTVVMADGNKAFLTQDGGNNAALVTQSGDMNEAGSSSLSMTQDGFSNSLTILQSGDDNDIGMEGSGILQQNAYAYKQYSIDITQASDNNTVGQIRQRATGDAGKDLRNSVDIMQDGLGYNRVGNVFQEQKSSGANVLDITQTGFGDRVETIYQRSNTGGNAQNRITVTMAGAGNGQGDLGGFAGATGATSSALKQGNLTATSRGNRITLNVTDVGNDFGVTQNGRDNTVGTLNLGGVGNDLGINQMGNGNTVSMASISGWFNEIGVKQLGDTNLASVSVSGWSNEMGIYQDGLSNIASVIITGHGNGLGAAWSGSALTVANATPMLDRGMVKQIGEYNTSSLIVSGNNNAFGLLQDGDSNAITGVQNGNYNQAAVAQAGDGNTANFTQTGNGNSLGISQ